MTRIARWLRRALLPGLGLAVAVACTTDDYKFVNEPKDVPAGCDNGEKDPGETSVDCGGECLPCPTGEGCVSAEDCLSQVCTDLICAAPACDDGIVNGTETGRDCGGGFCDGCGTGSPCTDAVDCRSGVCAGEEGEKKCEVSCVEGKAECDGIVDEECETNLFTDPMHCGDCETVCELAHAEQSCVSGACQIGSCREPYDDCNNRADDGCETNLGTAPGDCGGCGMECSDQNGTPLCENSECQIDCDDGFADCDDSRANGCEQSLMDVLSCGACDRVCEPPAGETAFCKAGMCDSMLCPAGRGNCDGEGDDCEQDLTSDIANCGRCSGTCTVFNGTPLCEEGVCGVDSCETGWANCNTSDDDGGYMDGCEKNINEDPLNCGACGRVCPAVNGTASCVAGECRVSCDTGWADCTGGVADGCETNTTNDDANCGVCARNCDQVIEARGWNATGKCVASACQRDQCLANFGDCDTNPDTCESDFRTDEGDCGACGTACVPTGVTSQGNECVSGTCTPHCDATHANCDTTGPNGCEINTATNATHCGGCNMGCTGGRPCINGMCGCSGGLTLCSDTCVNTTNNNANCGGCGITCTGGRTCVTSVCQCPAGQNFCGSTCVNLQTDPMNCGTCSRACQTPTGTTTNTCTMGACVPGCDTLRASCDMEPWDGCEVNLASNNANCGACNRACEFGASAHVNPATQAGNSCSAAGACTPTCAAGWGDCDSQPWDGCEADINGGDFCGACNVTCSGLTPTCVASGSTRSCQASIAVLGTPVSDGVPGPTLTLMHNLTLASGQNRMVVVAVVARATNGGIAQARPDAVTYATVAMTAGPEFDGGPPPGTDGQSHVFFYYLNNAGLPATTGAKAVVIDGSPGTLDPTVVAAAAVAFTGVRQTNPLSASVGGAFATCSGTVQPNNPVPIVTTGSVILSAAGAQYSGVASPTGSLTVLMDNETSPNTAVPPQESPMRAVAGLRGISPQLTTSGSPYTVGWNYAWCNNSVHSAVVVHPAQGP